MAEKELSANQLVAYNLRRAREARGETQESAALRLEGYLGRRWSKASFSDAERSADNGRARVFDADELLAFSQVFGRPVAWFFTAPDDVESVRCGPQLDVTRKVGRAELREATGRLMLRAQVDKLKEVVRALEMADDEEEQ